MSDPGSRQTKPYPALVSEATSLIVRQHPVQALATLENKEKGRKPIDPPPIVELSIDSAYETAGNFLVNPYLFMTAMLVEAVVQENGTHKAIAGQQLIGQNVSSLHRLKDHTNHDGGFFVFGDISCRRSGLYKLQFNLFEYIKGLNEVSFIDSVVSDEFNVVNQKEFRGLRESTQLSRSFSDQGVRLRLRKEARTLTGSKRPWNHSPSESYNTGIHENALGSRPRDDRHSSYEPSNKRQRTEAEYHPHLYPPAHVSAGAVPQYDTSLQSATHTWPAPLQLHSQTEHSVFSGLMHQPHAAAAWPGSRHQGPLSTPVGGSSGQAYFPPDPPLRPYHSSRDSQLPGVRFDSRIPSDGYSSYPGLHTTASMPDQNLIPTASGAPGHTVNFTSGYMPGLPDPQRQDPSSIEAYGMRPLPTSLAPAQDFTQSSDGHYQPPPYTTAFSESNLSLDTGLLNREFAPGSYHAEQQQPYNDMTQQEVMHLKQQQNPYYPYPAPHEIGPNG